MKHITVFSAAILTAILLVTLHTSNAAAASTTTIAYQGHLADASGNDLIADLPIEVRLYDSAIAGIGADAANIHVLYAEQHDAVHVEDGIFRINIGDGTSLDPKGTGLQVNKLAATDNIYLELWIDGERLSPRQKLGVMPAVFHAKYAKYADTVINMPAISPNDIHNYSADVIKTGFLNEAYIPGGLDVSLITGTLDEAFIPSISVDQFDLTGSLPTALINNLDAGKVTGGMIDKAMLPAGRYVTKNDFAVISGNAPDGQVLTLPNGFVDQQCVYMLTPGITVASIQDVNRVSLSVDTSGIVTCKLTGASPDAACTVNYMAICRKGYCRQGNTLVKC